ncbi:hypothetical protein [Sinorhizobium meliloti]|uniref:hypothetical protein n=1 Tax=Rhizobium meliloti TaxID=382 RepID=UPI0004844FF9|nr:hypothetical protein [Sinorhizobium meliloti]
MTVAINVAYEFHVSRVIGDVLPLKNNTVLGAFSGSLAAMTDIAACCAESYRKKDHHASQYARY